MEPGKQPVSKVRIQPEVNGDSENYQMQTQRVAEKTREILFFYMKQEIELLK